MTVRGMDSLWSEWRGAPRVDVVGLGQCALDRVVVVDGPPEFTGKKRIVELTEVPGGQIATAVLACTRLGLRAALLSAVGSDPASEIMLEPLREAGISQLLFLVLFSYAFFFEGYTGLVVTIGAILTLAALMQITAKVDWAEVFKKREKVSRPRPRAPTE